MKLGAGALLLAAPAILAQGRHNCSDWKQFAEPGLEIEKAEEIAAVAAGVMHISPAFPGTVEVPVPAYCRVDGTLDRRTGAEGKSYGIGFALALPDDWNGRFLFQGGGGLNGSVGTPLGATAAGKSPGLTRGFAVLSTDTGHKGSVFDASFMRDQQAALDFYYQANGRMAPLAKKMIAWYYGRVAGHSYFAGCSTGGREGMIMSQRYPAYFDGIVAGAPAMRTGHSNLALASIGAAFGAQPKQLLSEADRKLVIDRLMEACDAKDGLKDGMIFDREACHFAPAALECKGAKEDGCLSGAQVRALQSFSGPRTSHGDQVYPGFPWDAGMGESKGLPGLLAGPTIPVAMPAREGGFDVDREAFRVEENVGALLGDSTVTNLTTFAGRGGKLIFYHGLSDIGLTQTNKLPQTTTPLPAPRCTAGQSGCSQ